MSRSSLKYFFAIGLLCVLLAGEVFYLVAREKPQELPPRLQSKYFKKEAEQLSKMIDQLGAEEAYTKFLLEYVDKPPGSVHAVAHIFGELLYDKEGLSGVAVCDNSFGFGCYHSFFGRAISEHGAYVVKELDRACVLKWGEKALGCQHGIGHGLLWYMGEDKLAETLRICETLSWKGSIGGCSGGTFMEYNFHTMADPDGSGIRPFVAAEAHVPCSGLSLYREACYFDMPHWWIRSFDGDIVRAAALCREVDDQVEREACFKGVGNLVAPETKYNVAKSTEICDALATVAERVFCRAGASWSFFAEPSARELSPDLCIDLSSIERRRCVDGSQII